MKNRRQLKGEELDEVVWRHAGHGRDGSRSSLESISTFS